MGAGNINWGEGGGGLQKNHKNENDISLCQSPVTYTHSKAAWHPSHFCPWSSTYVAVDDQWCRKGAPPSYRSQ